MTRVEMVRPRIHEGVTYGRGGTYIVPDALALQWKLQKICKVIQQVSIDPISGSPDSKEAEFLLMAEKVAPELLQILEKASFLKFEAEREAKEKENSAFGENPDLVVPLSSSFSEETIGNQLEESGPTGEDVVTMSESEPEVEQVEGTPIGQDFPGYALLIAGGITVIEQIPETLEELMAVKGMSKRVINSIGSKLIQLGYREG